MSEAYRNYIINTPDVDKTIEDVAVKLGQRAEILLSVSEANSTREVRFLPTFVDTGDEFFSRGVVLPQRTEASIKAEDGERYLVMVANLDEAPTISDDLDKPNPAA